MPTGNPIPEFETNRKPLEKTTDYESVTVDGSFGKYITRGEIARSTYSEIYLLSQDINNPRVEEIRKFYPGWTQDDFKILIGRLTKAAQEGNLKLT